MLTLSLQVDLEVPGRCAQSRGVSSIRPISAAVVLHSIFIQFTLTMGTDGFKGWVSMGGKEPTTTLTQLCQGQLHEKLTRGESGSSSLPTGGELSGSLLETWTYGHHQSPLRASRELVIPGTSACGQATDSQTRMLQILEFPTGCKIRRSEEERVGVSYRT